MHKHLQNIYRARKTMSAQNRQSGVTLLLSILILSSIMAISFSLATILFVEVRTSGDLVRTEPAIYAANAITEQSLYKIKRQVPTSGGTCDPYYATKIGNVTLPCIVESTTSDPVQQIKVLASSFSFSNTSNVYPVYATTGDPKSGYGKIIVTYPTQGSSGSVHMYLCQFDILFTGAYDVPGPACSDPSSNSYWLVKDFILSPGTSKTVAMTDGFDPNKQQELVFVNSANADVYLQVSSFDSNGIAKGLPIFGQTSVIATANSAGTSRRIKVTTPIPANASNTNGAPTAGQIILTAQSSYDSFFNGAVLGSGNNYQVAQTYSVTFPAGKNVIAVVARQSGGCSAGVLGDITLNGVNSGTGIAWKVSPIGPAGWEQPGYDDTAWLNASDKGAYGVAPWGTTVSGMPAGTPGHWIWKNTGICGNDTLYLRGAIMNTGGAISNVASFIRTDTTSQGAWQSNGFGALGYNLITNSSDPGSYPSFVTVVPSGNNYYDWATTGPSPLGDPRALTPFGGGTQFIHTWYSPAPWYLDFNFSDTVTHQVALYVVDWDNLGRFETIDVLDGSTSSVLATHNVSTFNGGQYIVFNLKGHVLMKFTDLSGGSNSVVSGIFFQ